MKIKKKRKKKNSDDRPAFRVLQLVSVCENIYRFLNLFFSEVENIYEMKTVGKYSKVVVSL